MDAFPLEENSLSQITKKSSKKGIIAVGLTGGAAIAISILCYPFISPGLRRICLPFVPATNKQISNILRALEGRTGTLLDIGSGDGRIVLAAAKNGFKAHGIELNLWLVLYSRWLAFRNGQVQTTNFFRGDLWKTNFKPYDNLVIFGVKEMMNDLSSKFEKELHNSYVVACRFPLPNKIPIKIIGKGIDTVWLYHFSQL